MSASSRSLFPAESVTERHPDTIADAILAQDPTSRVAAETMITRGQVHVAGEVTPEKIEKTVDAVFDLRPGAIVRELNLLRPIYAATTAYGHFGWVERELPWENTDRAAALTDGASAGES